MPPVTSTIFRVGNSKGRSGFPRVELDHHQRAVHGHRVHGLGISSAMETGPVCLGNAAQTRMFDAYGLPMLDSVDKSHPEVQRLREWSLWSEGQVWVTPERHGTVTGVSKNQLDWLPLEDGVVRPTQGRTLAVMQVSGGSQSFNTVNTVRVLGRCRIARPLIRGQSSMPSLQDRLAT